MLIYCQFWILGDVAFLYEDVSERIQFEKILWEEKERAQITLESIVDAVLTTDIEGNITYLNSTAEKITGWTNEEAQGLSIETVFNINCENQEQEQIQPVRQCLRECKLRSQKLATEHIFDYYYEKLDQNSIPSEEHKNEKLMTLSDNNLILRNKNGHEVFHIEN